ncbi:hypothetical protein GDO81_024380 [Engystomops pustulosus]|uniref:Uncharacterized protein n=1 Tax=Engystomops pustulosus TaxID=76066 RepID=A0AAV6YQL7_ENGPU|nr:hypothetical protein GDO81_024380 [Engystomops pustulosus]
MSVQNLPSKLQRYCTTEQICYSAKKDSLFANGTLALNCNEGYCSAWNPISCEVYKTKVHFSWIQHGSKALASKYCFNSGISF